MILCTVVEEGDVIVVPANFDEHSALVRDQTYYIPREGSLVEVPWYVASEYQNEIREKKRAAT